MWSFLCFLFFSSTIQFLRRHRFLSAIGSTSFMKMPIRQSVCLSVWLAIHLWLCCFKEIRSFCAASVHMRNVHMCLWMWLRFVIVIASKGIMGRSLMIQLDQTLKLENIGKFYVTIEPYLQFPRLDEELICLYIVYNACFIYIFISCSWEQTIDCIWLIFFCFNFYTFPIIYNI